MGYKYTDQSVYVTAFEKAEHSAKNNNNSYDCL